MKILGKIAKKYPATARFLEGILYGSGISCLLGILTTTIAFLQTGDYSSFKLGVYSALVSFAVSFLQALSQALAKRQRDLQKN